MQVKLKEPISVPEELLLCLDKWYGNYTDPVCLYYIIQTDYGLVVGVFGDGDMATFEWFIWGERDILRTSNSGYGSPYVALRDGVLEVEKGLREETGMPLNPFETETGVAAVDADSRLRMVRDFTADQCQAALRLRPVVQKTVESAIHRRLRRLRRPCISARSSPE